MAEDSDSDTCIGFKRSISELSEVEGNQQSLEEQHSNSVSLEEQSYETVCPAKEQIRTLRNSFVLASESFNGLQKKVTCSSSDESETNIVAQENQETVDYVLQEIGEDKLGFENDVIMKLKNDGKDGSSSQSPNEKEKNLEKYETGFSGFQDFVEVEKNSSSRFSSNCTAIKEQQSVKEVLEACDKGLPTSYIAFDRNESESFLENKENQCLVEPEVGSMSVAKIYAVKRTEFESSREIMGDTIKIREEFGQSSSLNGKLAIVESADSDEKGSDCDNLDGPKGIGGAIKCSLTVEVIDETAVIETASASKGCGKGKGFVGFVRHSERNGDKKNVKQEPDGKEEKMGRRRGKGGKKVSWTNGKEFFLTAMPEAPNGCEKKGEETKRIYSRREMEALRFVNVESQRKKWIEVYCGLGPAVTREYESLVECKHQKHTRLNFDPRKRLGKKEESPTICSEEYSQSMDNEIENMNPLGPACGLSVRGGAVVEEEYSEDDDSDDDYSSIQRPAFFVTGEPNFDSGPPEDGLEYLRRVRWEAAQIPKVKVAKIERSKLSKEQTVYMPTIPDIVKCPEHLLPLKQWEDAFLADFSELRLALSHLEGSGAKISGTVQSQFIIHEEEDFHQLPESIILEKFDKLTTDGVESCQEALGCSIPENASSPRSSLTADENDPAISLEDSSPKSFANGSSGDSPTLSAILRMDSVARVSMLRKRISTAENMSTLSRNDCAWLFALCAAVDTPLDADTCAALRCLLRKSAKLRAGKSELDDEVIMLNILGTISGSYFGQSEN
ncbi:hypothetical protein F0562_034594 [Nyssa sinensis]|uniref:Gem-associated protein 2 n=1 Tax=Nyssa sinensis TaxID=561372 RepID=A0A5J5AAH9_9ASTE|nr:hypothetical protein F0562_034594 [Nyssa sinensis]